MYPFLIMYYFDILNISLATTILKAAFSSLTES